MKNAFDLSGKTILVAGGAGLLGESFTRQCIEAGASVVVADTDVKKGKALRERIEKEFPGARISFEAVDTADDPTLDKLAARVEKTCGALDGVVNASFPRSKNYGKSFDEARVEDMLETLSMNVGSCLSLVKAFAPQMKEQKRGAFIFLGSIYGIAAPRFEIYEGTTMTKQAEYAAMKGAVISLTRFFAALLGPHGVRVNCVSPGGIEDGQPESFIRAYGKRSLIGRGLLSSDDIAGTIVFLLSDASLKLTGQNIVVDAGWTI